MNYSLIMNESRYFLHNNEHSEILIEHLIYSAFQKDHIEIRRASLLSLICLLRLDGSENTLKNINEHAQKQLYELKF